MTSWPCCRRRYCKHVASTLESFVCAGLAGVSITSVSLRVGTGWLPTGGRRLRSPPRSPVRGSPDGICPSGRQYRQRSPLALDVERPGQGALFCITGRGRGSRYSSISTRAGHRSISGSCRSTGGITNNASGRRSGHSTPITTCGSRRRSCAIAIRADQDWWAAVGCYHAPNSPQRAARYRTRVRAHWQRVTEAGKEASVAIRNHESQAFAAS